MYLTLSNSGIFSISRIKSDNLNFNHPLKELIWCDTQVTADGLSQSVAGGNWKLKLNGHDRFAARDFRYFTRTQVWQHHTGVGGLTAAAGSGPGKPT